MRTEIPTRGTNSGPAVVNVARSNLLESDSASAAPRMDGGGKEGEPPLAQQQQQQQQPAVNRPQDSPEVMEAYPGAGGAPALTQNDCVVVWNESRNFDLRQVTSPAFLHTPKTPSTRASTSTTGGAASSSLGDELSSAAPRIKVAAATALDTLVGADVPPTTAAVAPSSSDSRKHAGSRTSSLGSVTKCLENQEGEGLAGSREDNAPRTDAAGPSEVELIFNLLERDSRPPESGSSSSSATSAAISSPSSDEVAKGIAGNVGPVVVVASKSRKRRRHQHLALEESARQPSTKDGKENAINRPTIPSLGGTRKSSAVDSMDVDPGTNFGGTSTSVGSASSGGSDPFRDLLREVQLKRTSSSNLSETVDVSPKPSTVPEQQPSRIMSSTVGALSPAESCDVARTPPPIYRADHQGSGAKDEFGDVDFSLDDLALIDSMVQHATQPEGDEAGATTSQAGVVSSAQMPQKQDAQSPDPFGDFPDMDFDALDKSIVDHQSHGPLDHTPVANPHPGTSLGFLQFTRYHIWHVTDDPSRFIKALSVQVWTPAMLPGGNTNFQPSSRTPSQAASDTRPTVEAKPRNIDGEIHLCGDWYFTPLVEGDVVHVCSPSGQCNTRVDASGPLVLDTHREDDLLLIVHPEMLLTPTTISETVTCSRRAVLKNRLGSTGLSAKAPLFGTMRHALFEEMMRVKDFSMAYAQRAVKMIARKNAEALVATGLTSTDAEIEILKVVPQIQEFVAEFTTFGEARNGNVPTSPNLVPAVGCAQPTVQFTAHDVEAIEELVVSPVLGLKGNIDMVVQARMTNSLTSQSHSMLDASLTSIELKTGHHQTAQHSHMAQLTLYTLMLNSSYGMMPGRTSTTANDGVLLYLNNEALKAVHVAPKMFEIKALIGNRNLVAIETRRSSRPRGLVLSYQSGIDRPNDNPSIRLLDPTPTLLPDVLNNSHGCERCYMNRECMVYAAAAEVGKADPSVGSILQTHKELLAKFAGRLRDDDLTYFVTWDRLVDLEGSACTGNIAEAWLLDSLEREKTTLRCISSLSFESGNDNDCSSVSLSFRRSHMSSQHNSFQNLSFEIGCHVVVSTDDTTASPSVTWKWPRMCIVRGIFENASESRVTIKASPDDLGRLRRFIQRSRDPTQLLFRLDRDEVATGLGTLRQNIVNFLSQDATQELNQNRLSWLRDVVIRLKSPLYDYKKKEVMFNPPENVSVRTFPGCDFLDLSLEYAELNDDQRAAADKVMAATDYSMIQGLPGTGKTSTIAFLARLLVAHGKRVLITSYTNSAVDNVLLKLMENGLAATSPGISSPAMLRIGRDSSTHPHVHPILAANAAVALENSMSLENDTKENLPSADYLSKCVRGARVVGVTALTLPRSPLLSREHFDVVIVDEAGQITQPAVLGALMSADSFILVGDHQQLPPLVASEAAELGGFGESMLKRLAEAHPTSVAMLSYQYRMNREICLLSNEIAYGGALKCADEAVANRKLDLPDFLQSLGVAARDSWLARSVDPDFPVAFVDTDAQRKFESDGTAVSLERTTGRNGGGSIVNDTEAEVVQVLVGSLMSCGLAASSIGVICPFRAQLRLLDEQDRVRSWKSQGLEVSTIDRYQGRDKDAIILSFVRSNSKGKVGRLLEDYRRLNVAVTRAKCKLVMVGSFSTLVKGSTHLRGSLERLRREGKVIPCDLLHA